jgi:hypothetical protein
VRILQDALDIAGKIPHHRIDLREGDFHAIDDL